MERLEAAEQEFVQGRPAEFQSLWSRTDDVTLCGGFGGVERGWQNVTPRLDWVSTKYADGSRTSEKISSVVGTDFAYLVQTEVIRARIAGQVNLQSRSYAPRCYFGASKGWRIVHRHADSQMLCSRPGSNHSGWRRMNKAMLKIIIVRLAFSRWSDLPTRSKRSSWCGTPRT